jgi:hypothetical protein
MSSGSKKRNPDMYSRFLSKVPVNEPPPSSPTGPLWRELPFYKAFFYISPKFFIQISVNKENFPFPQRLKRGAYLHVPQMETDAHS